MRGSVVDPPGVEASNLRALPFSAFGAAEAVRLLKVRVMEALQRPLVSTYTGTHVCDSRSLTEEILTEDAFGALWGS